MTRQFLRFGLVGIVGFIVDSSVLTILLTVGLGPYLGRVASFLAAVTLTWSLNRSYTFQDSSPNPVRQWARFAVVNGIGGCINFGVYVWLISTLPVVFEWPILGVAAGSVSGMLWNFFASRLLVFREQPTSHADRVEAPRP